MKSDSVKVKIDFDKARLKQFFNSVFSLISNKPNSLYSFEEINKFIKSKSQSYRGIQAVPLKNIVGSEGRYKDFDRYFLPKNSFLRWRWENIDKAYYEGKDLPPVSLYKINKFYFVKDGNHRVSVALEQDIEFIDAEVVELELNFDVDSVEDLKVKILELEMKNFYDTTNIKKLRTKSNIVCSVLGNYDIILSHIEGHKYFMDENKDTKISYEDAVVSWYDKVYFPIIELSKDEEIIDCFNKRTLSDLYIWIVDYWHKLKLELEFPVLPEIAIEEYAANYGDKFLPGFKRRINEYLEKIF